MYSIYYVMMTADATLQPIHIDGRFFRTGDKHFFGKGFTYGPFPPTEEGIYFPIREQVILDFEQIKSFNANLLRVYYVPPEWFLDEAAAHGLRLFIDVPWGQHLDFLNQRKLRQDAFEKIRSAAHLVSGHPSVFALCICNEFAPDLIRWSGRKELAQFVENLIEEAKSIDQSLLCTFSNYPTTEFFTVESVDFYSFNVYLHSPIQFKNYLSRLSNLTDSKPLFISETGVDSLREGEQRQAEIIRGKLKTIRDAGLSGCTLFSYTDEWFTGSYLIEDWKFGVVDTERKPKISAEVVKKIFQDDFLIPPISAPKISVVIATYNGARTLQTCLESLKRINYPNYEVIVVNDGSTDATAEIVGKFPEFKLITHDINQGLSAARNTGFKASQGEIIAYTDDDCRVDEYWLLLLCNELINSKSVAIGGPNYLPPEDSPVSKVVMAAPGGPAAVLLDDQTAEHIPGCNMAFWKWALEEINGFDPIFTKAGDDVDICWRILQKGWQIRWCSSGFVWHARRNTIRAYLRQQYGYGEAEELLRRKHPCYFNSFGACIWKGKIYAGHTSIPSLGHDKIYHGVFGSGLFQTLYTPKEMPGLLILTSFEYHIIVTLPLVLLGTFSSPFMPLAFTSLILSLSVCILSAKQQKLENEKFWSRPLVALLFLLQPICRSYARYKTRFLEPHPSLKNVKQLPCISNKVWLTQKYILSFWAEKKNSIRLNRIEFLHKLQDSLSQKGNIVHTDTGWNEFDLLIHGEFCARLQLLTFIEPHKDQTAILKIKLFTFNSGPFKILFSLFLFFEILLIALFHNTYPFIWIILILIPILPLYAYKQRTLLLRYMIKEITFFAQSHSLLLISEKK